MDWWQAGHSSDQRRLVGCLRYRWQRGPASASAVSVRCDSHTANVDPVLPRRPDPVYQVWAEPITSCSAPCRRPPGVSVPVVCGILQPSQWLMLLRATPSNITSMLTTPSYISLGTPTTHPTDWPFSPSVPAERTPAQSRQMASIDHWHHQSAASCQVSRLISVCCRSRSTSSWWDESTRRCAWPATNVRETCHDGGWIMQLPRASHLPHMPRTVNWSCNHTCV